MKPIAKRATNNCIAAIGSLATLLDGCGEHAYSARSARAEGDVGNEASCECEVPFAPRLTARGGYLSATRARDVWFLPAAALALLQQATSRLL